MSNLIVSFGESSNLCILGIIFLGSYLCFLHVLFQSLSCASIQAQVHQKRISNEKLIVFLILKVLPIVPLQRGQNFTIWFYPPMMYYDVSLHNLVVLVVASSTSPRSSKTESGVKRYRTFSKGDFLETGRPAWPAPGRVSWPQAGRFCQGAILDAARPALGRVSRPQAVHFRQEASLSPARPASMFPDKHLH